MLALLAPAASWAQQPPSANAVLMAKEILDLKEAGLLYEAIIPQIVDRAKNLFLQTNPMLSRDLNEVAARVRTEMNPRKQEMVNLAARAYASRFSEAELKDVLAFYKTPVGRKVIVEEAKILDQTVTVMQQWADKMSDDVINRFRAEMKKKGHDL
jgi:hypothetical protein